MFPQLTGYLTEYRQLEKDYLHSSQLRESYSTTLLYGFSRLRELLMKSEKYLLLVGLQACAIHPSWKNCAVQLCQPNGS